MIQDISLTLSPEEAFNESILKKSIAFKCNMDVNNLHYFKIKQRSIDARKKDVKVHIKATIYDEIEFQKDQYQLPDYKNVENAKEVFIIGLGPAGLFAALELIERGYKPVILERGKKVEERKKDIAQLNRNIGLDENSNYCFGEGGAGTFSDGKLYTRSKKKGDIKKILHLLHHFGANADVTFDSHPHIGSDKLPTIIKNIRNFIIERGGEIHFGTHVKDFEIVGGEIKKIICDSIEFDATKVILATGHSAKDIYYLLNQKNIVIEAKPFALGVRIEHPQALINNIQYHNSKNKFLPAASYKLVEHIDERAVFSFCMCPGGFIVPSASFNNELVVNGMSPAKRNSPFANSGMVVQVNISDYKDYANHGGLAGIKFQESIEKNAFQKLDMPFRAPAQRLVDFCENKSSQNLPNSSYIPGLVNAKMNEFLPEIITDALKSAFPRFNRKMKGYFTNEAIIVGIESRTSSPVRIPRDKETYQQTQITNLYPCGEGAGYAGGITSSAIDGINVARAV